MDIALAIASAERAVARAIAATMLRSQEMPGSESESE